jgi:sugar O-acyltransferase (sialic acid O-acetyltransferase NeuD family)
MSRPVIIFGATDLARLANHYLTNQLGRSVSAYVVDSEWMPEEQTGAIPVVDFASALSKYPPESTDAFVAIGYRSMRARQQMLERVIDYRYSLCCIIAPGANISPNASIGANAFIHPGAVIEPFTTIGSNAVIWSNAVVCHDARLGDHTFVAAGAVIGGHASVGSRCFVGFGATILQHVTVGNDVLVAAGSMIRCDAKALGAYRGTPARRVSEIDPMHGVTLG